MLKVKTRDNSVFYALQTFIPSDAKIEGQDALSKFADMRVQTGDTSRLLFEGDMRSMVELVELAYMVEVWGIVKTYTYLKEQVIPKLEEMHIAGTRQYHSVLVFDSSLVAEQKENEEVMLALNDDLGPLTDIASCGRCGATKVHRKMKQTRSADEGITAIFTCPNCQNTWNEN